MTDIDLDAIAQRSGAVEPLDGCACDRCNGITHSRLGACFIEHQHGCDGGHDKRERCNDAARHSGGEG